MSVPSEIYVGGRDCTSHPANPVCYVVLDGLTVQVVRWRKYFFFELIELTVCLELGSGNGSCCAHISEEPVSSCIKYAESKLRWKQ